MIFDDLRAFWPCIDNNATDMFKAQKDSKDIIKIVPHTELVVKADTEDKKLLNKADIFVFFAHSLIKLRINHWCHMDYFNDVLTNFLGLELVSCVAVYAGSESSHSDFIEIS